MKGSRFGVFLVVVAALGFVAGTVQPTRAQQTSDQVITFQARLTQAGSPVTGSMNLTFEVHDQPSGPTTALWSEPIPAVQVSNGLISVRLGETVPLGNVFAAGVDRYVAIKETLTGAEIVTPRVKLTAVPYALNSGSGGGVPVGTIVDWFRPDASTPIPTGWAICDGSQIIDPLPTPGPFHLRRVPDLGNLFVIGLNSIPAGYGGTPGGAPPGLPVTGGSQSLDVSHSHGLGGHSHGMDHTHTFDHSHSLGSSSLTGRTGGANQNPPQNPSIGGDNASYQGGIFVHQHDFNVTLGGSTGSTGTSLSTSSPSNGSTGGPSGGSDTWFSGALENRPPFVGLLKIIRIR